MHYHPRTPSIRIQPCPTAERADSAIVAPTIHCGGTVTASDTIQRTQIIMLAVRPTAAAISENVLNVAGLVIPNPEGLHRDFIFTVD